MEEAEDAGLVEQVSFDSEFLQFSSVTAGAGFDRASILSRHSILLLSKISLAVIRTLWFCYFISYIPIHSAAAGSGHVTDTIMTRPRLRTIVLPRALRKH